MSKKIRIIGSGTVVQSLGAGFLKHGYELMLGTRDAAKLSEWQTGEGNGAQTGSFADTAAFGDIVVLAVKGTAAKAALELAGAENLNGKTIIDAANPIADAPPENGVLKQAFEGATVVHAMIPMAFDAAIGKPDLNYKEFTYEDFRQALMGQMGASESVADNFIGFIHAVNEGKVTVGQRTEESTTPTTIEEFAQTFKYVYEMN